MIEPERLDYPLTADSLVWDVGAYRGEFSVAASKRWGCDVMAFEPVIPWYHQIVGKKFADDDRAAEIFPGLEVWPFGLAERDFWQDVPIAGDRTSAYAEAGNDPLYHAEAPMRLQFKDVIAFMDLDGITSVDLAKINIEGGEYALLRRLIDAGYISRFRYLQVQFHTFMPEFGEKYLALKKDLEKTHCLSWRWPWRWESWARR